MNELQEKLRHLPREPGIYVMKDAEQRIIYVGKAKSLKVRVASYFRKNTAENPRLCKLVDEIRDVGVFVVTSEREALLLERTLIRHHRPLYNVLFTDDKEYPLIRVSTQEDWPTFRVVRKRVNDGASYLGPFGSGYDVQLLLDLIQRIFPLVRCSSWEFAHARRPCNYYYMKQCLGPCSRAVEPEEYRSMVQQAIAVVQGKNQEVRAKLTAQMHEASQNLNFERAARLRDQLQAMAHLKDQEQVVVNNALADCDIIGSASEGEQLCLALLKIRDSKIAETLRFAVHLPLAEASEGIFSFLLQYYGVHPLPKEIVVAAAPPQQKELGELFTSSHKIVVPQRGTKKSLLAIATRNASLHLEEMSREHLKRQEILQKLQLFFKLPLLPQRIECLDISHHQGSATVASIVCFKGGAPSKSDYRHYSLAEQRGEPDDFKSIYQIMLRRLQKAAEEREPMPELMVIDGGKGQLSAALSAARRYPQLSCSIIALAKSKIIPPRSRGLSEAPAEKSPERVFVPGSRSAVALPEGSEVFRLLTHLRDEAHRFAISFHRRKQVSQTIASPLQQVPGIGPKLRQRILGYFPSQQALLEASSDELAQIPGLSLALATRLYSYLHDRT